MRKLIAFAAPLAAATLMLLTPGCRSRQTIQVETIEEETPSLASMVHVADPRASVQLLKGFHDVEQNAWRWTMGRFSVTLRPPAGAAEKGAYLYVKLVVPEPVIQRTKAMRLDANVEGAAIEGETYTKPGEFVFRKEVPAQALKAGAVTAVFALDQFLAAGSVEERELGIIVSSIGLEAK